MDNKISETDILIVIKSILAKFQEIYCTPKYYGTFASPVARFTTGYCGIFAVILKNVFPNGVFYYFGNNTNGHIVLKIDDYFYDATGIFKPEDYPEDYALAKLDSIYECISILPWDFVFNTDRTKHYTDMISVCSLAGIECLNKIKGTSR